MTTMRIRAKKFLRTIAEKISILISVGSESIAKSELINIVADTEIEILGLTS